MTRAVEGPLGRKFTTGAKVPGITTAGKSGTAELGGKGEPHSWFIGFAPAEQPTIAIAVLVEQAGRGAEVAAPIAGDLMTLLPAGWRRDATDEPMSRTRRPSRANRDRSSSGSGLPRSPRCWPPSSAGSRSRPGSVGQCSSRRWAASAA